jgi:hypothetical protein
MLSQYRNGFASRRIAPATLTTYSILAVYALLIGWHLQPNVLYDDAAITFRYVERLATGHGLTYNDHERVLGTSNPLYTLLLFLVTRSGIDVETAARVMALILFCAVALVTMYCTSRLSGSKVAGFLAGTLLVTNDFFRYQSLSGMESILSVFLGLLTVAAILQDRDIAAGIFLGLAVWNKLDAGMLALAVTAAWLLVRHRLPLQIGLTSVVVVLPWMIFAQWYYGSPLPHSFIVKVQGSREPFNHAWIVMFLLSSRACFLLLALGAFGILNRFSERGKLAVVTLFAWFLFHALAFSLLDLSDYFPWYLTVLVPPLIVLACVLVGQIFATTTPFPGRRTLGALAVAVLVVASHRSFLATYNDLATGNPLKPFEAFDNDRRLAGIFLNQYADPGEVVSSGFGWVAFEAKRAFNDGSQLNSKQMLPDDAYQVLHGVPWSTGSHPPQQPEGFVPLAMFNLASDLSPGSSWFTVFGRPDSKIAVHGPRYLQYRLFELSPPQPWLDESRLKNVSVTGVDLLAHSPSGATFFVENARRPVFVVFTPFVETGAPTEKTDGVTFEVWSDGSRRYQNHVLPTDNVDPVILPIAEANSRDKVMISFVTSAGRNDSFDDDRAIWRTVKIVVSDRFIDRERIHNQKLAAIWSRHNPGLPVAAERAIN